MKRQKEGATSRCGRKMPFSVRFGILITVLIMIVVATGVLMAPGLKLSEVYCEGNVNVKSEDIFSAAQIENGKNIFLVGIGRAKRNIDKLPMVKSVSIRRVFPDKICIAVEERVPLAYIKAGGEYAAIDESLTVVRKEDGEKTGILIANNIPNFEKPKNDNTDDKKISENNEKEDKTSEEKADGSDETEQPNEEIKNNELFNIPLIEGVELKNAEENKKAKCEDEEKLSKVVEFCVALNKAGLLNRATYLNLTDMQNINLVIENRLDVRLGIGYNIEYRAKFLAEVINNKISAYETLILDYTGDDIYARAHDDGKDRTKIMKDDDENKNIDADKEETTANNNNDNGSEDEEDKSAVEDSRSLKINDSVGDESL